MSVGSATIDCRNGELDTMSAALLQMAVVFSELELQMIRARVKSDVAHAKASKKVWRPRLSKEDILQAFYRHYAACAAGKINLTWLSRMCDLSRLTVYKCLKLLC